MSKRIHHKKWNRKWKRHELNWVWAKINPYVPPFLPILYM